MIPNIRLYLEVGAAAVLLIGFMLFVHHERTIGAANLQHSVNAATAQATRLAAQQTQALQAKSDKAALEASDAQAKLDTYVRDNPLQPVRVCVATHSGTGVPKAGATPGSAPSPGTIAGTVPEVYSGGTGVDIRPALDSVVRAAGRLDVLYAQFQAR